MPAWSCPGLEEAMAVTSEHHIYIYYSSVLYIQRSSSTEAWQLSWTMGGMRPSLIHRSCSRADATSHLDRLLHSIVVCLEKDIEQLGVLNVTI